MNDRERQIAKHILWHCEEVMDTVRRFDASKNKFKSDHVFYNACSMAVFQIGELSKQMSDEFKKSYAELPWSEMRGMRNLFAHQYESVDKDLLWERVYPGFCVNLPSDVKAPVEQCAHRGDNLCGFFMCQFLDLI